MLQTVRCHLAQTGHKRTQFAQHVRLIGEENEVICPLKLDYTRTRHASLKGLNAPLDPVQVGIMNLLNRLPCPIALHVMSLHLILDRRRKRNECKNGRCDLCILRFPCACDDRVTDTSRCPVLAYAPVGRGIKAIAQLGLREGGAVGPPLPFPVRLERSQV